MRRSLFNLVTIFSTLFLLLFGGFYLRSYFADEDFRMFRWNPSTLSFRDVRVALRGGGVSLHTESATALASDNTTAIGSLAGLSNSSFVHTAWSRSGPAPYPLLWGDHYRCTPDYGINQNGLMDCWTLQLHCDAAAALFAICPAIWIGAWLFNRLRKPPPAFEVITTPTNPARQSTATQTAR